MNKGKKESKQLPDSTSLLYDKYVEYGLISEEEKEGGSHLIDNNDQLLQSACLNF
ncbi:MAG: hypothetical protein M0Q51_14475 [Bacteroidales bacterium]|nr:hypothetical protein [Bacteroidales bacterium]